MARPAHPVLNVARPGATLVLGVALLALMLAIALAAPWLTPFDPTAIAPASRNLPSGAIEHLRADDGSLHEARHWMGTDSLGRDIASRTLYGARVSLLIALAVAFLATAIGAALGVVAGYVRALDNAIMRVMDGLMAIPAVLLAIALVAVARAGVPAVIVAIVVTAVPQVVRLARAVVLSVREEPYVDAAIVAGTPTPRLVWRHVLPATYSALAVQATYVAATAILLEAILSFLGVGIPPQTPTWGNVMAEGRALFRIAPGGVLWPGLFVAVTVLAVNLVGDALRDRLDPRARQVL